VPHISTLMIHVELSAFIQRGSVCSTVQLMETVMLWQGHHLIMR